MRQRAVDAAGGDLDEAFDDDDGEDGGAHLDQMRAMQSYLAAGGMNAARDYDDEDEALQAALAASLVGNESGPAGGNASSRLGQSTASLPEGYDPDTFEAQANAAALASARRTRTPPPQDVERIARMREEARRKEQEERDLAERRARGEQIESPPPATSRSKVAEKDDDDEDDDDDDDDDEGGAAAEEVVSAEEMRRRRLARFNA